MAINPDTIPQDIDRYFPNTGPLLHLDNTKIPEYLLQEISFILQACPPTLPFASVDRLGRCHRGLFLGPTSLAYFFLLLSKSPHHPNLIIQGKTPLAWCHAYLSLGQENTDPSFDTTCGISNPFLAFHTVYACAHNDSPSISRVLSALNNLPTVAGHCSWLNGRAGALYLLRVLKTHLPTTFTSEIDLTVQKLIREILSQDPWVWEKREYIGTVHGSIGILTQIVLSDPSTAPRVEEKLGKLLDCQLENGNWPIVAGHDVGRDSGLLHFCHGAPGVVISLLAIRSYFPALRERIDITVEKGRELIWEKGLLRKEPNLCHGIFGNALALRGERRGHFLACATPDEVREGIAEGRFVGEEMGRWELLWGAAGRAWVWMDVGVGEGEGEERVVLFSDV